MASSRLHPFASTNAIYLTILGVLLHFIVVENLEYASFSGAVMGAVGLAVVYLTLLGVGCFYDLFAWLPWRIRAARQAASKAELAMSRQILKRRR